MFLLQIREKTLNIVKKVAVLMQIFAVSQFGCGQDVFRKNTMKKTMKVNHWGYVLMSEFRKSDYKYVDFSCLTFKFFSISVTCVLALKSLFQKYQK